MGSTQPTVFTSTDLVKMVGVGAMHLNKYIERTQFGIEASVRPGEGRRSLRLFSEDDLFGVALVWWLFESGLRSEAIQFVLNQILNYGRQSPVYGGRGRNAKANEAATILQHRNVHALVIKREPRTARTTGVAHAEQRIFLCEEPSDSPRIVHEASTANILVVPVGTLFANLRKRMSS